MQSKRRLWNYLEGNVIFMLDMYTNVCCINNNKLTLLKASRGLKGREERGRDTEL